MVLLAAFIGRAGADRVVTNHRCTGIEQDDSGATAHFEHTATGAKLPPQRGSVVIACDGMHSVIRKQFFPDEGPPRYSGINMWRGVTRWKPFLDGATFVRVGWHQPAKVLIYPIRDNIDGEGRQLINWVIEVSRPNDQLLRDWNRKSRVEAFIGSFEHCTFDWLDIPAVLRAADAVYEYPMVDQDPLPFWTADRITLLGDAAHPMMPRGSNGAAQAIIDATTLAGLLAGGADWPAAFKAYEAKRLQATANVVLANRGIAPDAIIRVVEERTGGKPFARIEDVISRAELVEWQERYRKVAGFAADDLKGRAAQA
jgi:2-polyprenyl-6-methoxyphenol hydroxylase-like FAD-dependent oxidoreductase